MEHHATYSVCSVGVHVGFEAQAAITAKIFDESRFQRDILIVALRLDARDHRIER